jgi:soluble lytic murein transglycosylase-like protein
MRRLLIAGGFCCAAASLAGNHETQEATAAPLIRPAKALFRPASERPARRVELTNAPGQNTSPERLRHWHEIYKFATRYRIGTDLASAIHENATREGIEPELAFRLVRAESEFKERATSPVGAVGLTQLMPSTARFFDKHITRERLYDRHTNLRIGFRYLRTLIREYHGDLRLALLVYNRGPVAVDSSLEAGIDPANGYETIVMKGYRGRGVLTEQVATR